MSLASSASTPVNERPKKTWKGITLKHFFQQPRSQSSTTCTTDARVVPLPRSLSDRIPQELFEQFIDHLQGHKQSLINCSLVCRAWFTVSRYHLFQSLIVRPLQFNSGYHWGNVTCSVALRGEATIIYGTDEGVYRVSRYRETEPIKVLSLPGISQIDVLESHNILLILSANNLLTVPLDTLSYLDGTKNSTLYTCVSSHVSFFKLGVLQRRTFLCVVKVKPSLSETTIKLMEPKASQTFGNKVHYVMQKEREFYISEKTVSIHFLRTKLVAGTARHGFEMIDVETFHTQGLLDPASPTPNIDKKAKSLAIYPVGQEYLLCYDTFGMYVDGMGRVSRPHTIQWRVQPVINFAFCDPYLLIFSDSHIEVRHARSGTILQTIWINNRLISPSPELCMIQSHDGRVIGLQFPG